MNAQLTERQATELAQPLIKIIKEFYRDPKNVAAYEKWKAEREKAEEGEKC